MIPTLEPTVILITLLYNNVGVFGLPLIRRVVYSHEIAELRIRGNRLLNCKTALFSRFRETKKNVIVKITIEIKAINTAKH